MNQAFNRRKFLLDSAMSVAGISMIGGAADALGDARGPDARDRIEGLLLGSMIGDALGGPVEFQDPLAIRRLEHPPKHWAADEKLDGNALTAAAHRAVLRSYRDLRPVPEPYAHWTRDAEPGSVTDDSRHKLILLFALRRAEAGGSLPLSLRDFARAHLDWPTANGGVQSSATFKALCANWLREWDQGARWVLGERDLIHALPPQRMWGGLPTCCGQMSLLPLAAVHAGNPERAYRTAYRLGFFDNGFGKDLNAGLVAGLASALIQPTGATLDVAAFEAVFARMREVDPYGYGRVPWVTRPLDRWLDLALSLVDRADGYPARLFAELEDQFKNTIKWEAQVPFVVAIACLALCRYHPLAALQLSIEWGHDTDSYAQIVGAFVGAIYGASIFPMPMRTAVTERLWKDYQVRLGEEVDLLVRLEKWNRDH